MQAAERLIVALDVPTIADAAALVKRIGPACGFYKIGLGLLYAGGAELAGDLIAQGKRVFIDAKLLDIETTVERATASIARIGAAFLTVHGTDSKTLAAARRGRGDSPLKLLAVSVLTNLDGADLIEQGIERTPSELALHRAHLAARAGIDGVIASGHEAAAIRKAHARALLIVTPGIRPAGSNADEQTRAMTPGRAIAAGADYIVVGRPVTLAPDPRRAAVSIADEIAASSQP